MRKTYSIFLFIIFCIGFYNQVLSQEINLLYNLRNTPQANLLNPARINHNSKVTINLPFTSGFDFKLQNTFSISDFFSIENQTAIFNFENLQNSIGNDSYFSQTFGMPWVHVGVRFNENMVSFSITEQQLFRTSTNRQLIQLINEGNQAFVEEPFKTYFDLNLLHYREYAAGYTRQLLPELSVGGRVKLLTGIAAIDIKKLNIELHTGSNLEYLRFMVDGEYNLSLPININNISDIANIKPLAYFTNGSNIGTAIDLGASYRPIPELELSASIIDLGFIRWKTNATNITHSGSFTWRGLYINQFFEKPQIINNEEIPEMKPLEQLGDSLKEIFDFNVQEKPFSTGMPTKLFISGEYTLDETFSASLTNQLFIYNHQLTNALTLAGNLKLGNVWALSAGYSIIERSYNNLSLATSLKLGPFQFYAATSNILSMRITQTSNFSIRFGMNFMFGKIEN
ncbi:MAG TPA: DUF5723 family protein [Prolixibacteraceae bacterium]|nr:DUF5723 family protein [Prolixibacteraceae bacterium]